MKKDLRKLTKALEEQGFTVRVSRRGHILVFNADGLVATFSGTPSDWRSLKNSMAALKRAGFRSP